MTVLMQQWLLVCLQGLKVRHSRLSCLVQDSDERALAYIAGKAPSRWGSFGADSPVTAPVMVVCPQVLPPNARSAQHADPARTCALLRRVPAPAHRDHELPPLHHGGFPCSCLGFASPPRHITAVALRQYKLWADQHNGLLSPACSNGSHLSTDSCSIIYFLHAFSVTLQAAGAPYGKGILP